MAVRDVRATANQASPNGPSIPEGDSQVGRKGLAGRAASFRDGCRRELIRFLTYLLIASSFAFMVMPWLDVTVSGWFASPDGSFPLGQNSVLTAFRDINRLVPPILLPTLAAIVLVQAFSSRLGWLPRPHQALYVLGVYAIGSGLVVTLLKEIVARARPADTIPFGGTAPYTIPWQLADACARNCSFPGGEAGSAAAMMSCIVLAPASMRLPLFWVLVPFAIAFSMLRVAFGKHFLSDVVVSWLLVAIVAVALWRFLETHGARIDRAIIGRGRPLVGSTGRLLWRTFG